MRATVSSLLVAAFTVHMPAQRAPVTPPEPRNARAEAAGPGVRGSARLEIAPRAAVPLGTRDDLVQRVSLENAAIRQAIANKQHVRRACHQALGVLDQTGDWLRSATPLLRGSVVTVGRDGKLLTIKLDHEAGDPTPGDRLAIHASRRYKGEFTVGASEGDYVFGRLITAPAGVTINVGDLADSQPDREIERPSANSEFAKAIDTGMAAILRARGAVWEQPDARPVRAEQPTPEMVVEPGRLYTVSSGKRKPATPPAPPELRSLPAQEALARLTACRDRLRVADERAVALAALDEAAKALMTLHRLLITTSPAGGLDPKAPSGSPEAKVQGR